MTSDAQRAWQSVYNKAYREEHAERLRAAQQDYRATNAEALKARSHAYYEKNKERLKARTRARQLANFDADAAQRKQRREANLARYRQYGRDHYTANKHDYLARATARKEHVKVATPPWADPAATAEVYALAQFVQGITGHPYHVDHVVPLRGKTVCGLHVHWNLQVLPGEENLAKRNKLLCEVA